MKANEPTILVEPSMKIKVSETTPIQLDWLVAKCLWPAEMLKIPAWWFVDHPDGCFLPCIGDCANPVDGWYPSSDPAQGQPILERAHISTIWTPKSGHWSGYDCHRTTKDAMERSQDGPTMLIAWLRCYVASKLGDEVEVPEELL